MRLITFFITLTVLVAVFGSLKLKSTIQELRVRTQQSYTITDSINGR